MRDVVDLLVSLACQQGPHVPSTARFSLLLLLLLPLTDRERNEKAVDER